MQTDNLSKYEKYTKGYHCFKQHIFCIFFLLEYICSKSGSVCHTNALLIHSLKLVQWLCGLTTISWTALFPPDKRPGSILTDGSPCSPWKPSMILSSIFPSRCLEVASSEQRSSFPDMEYEAGMTWNIA